MNQARRDRPDEISGIGAFHCRADSVDLQQIAKHEKQLNEATGKKEYDALQAEIASGSWNCLLSSTAPATMATISAATTPPYQYRNGLRSAFPRGKPAAARRSRISHTADVTTTTLPTR